jgi:hypothetical protein
MTYPEQREYIEQMRFMPIVKLQRDINHIKNMIGSYIYYDHKNSQTNWKWDPDFDEGETESTRQAEDLWRIRQEAIKHGITPPKKFAE